MKVKELVKILSDFNPNCETNITDYGWSNGEGGDCCDTERNIEKEKLEATELHLYEDGICCERCG